MSGILQQCYFTDHDTAFATTRGTRQLLYTVRKTPSILRWQVFAADTSSKEHLLCTYYGGAIDEYDHIAMPSPGDWWYDHWVTLSSILAGNSPGLTRLGYCKRCGKLLTSAISVARGYGDSCYIATLEERR